MGKFLLALAVGTVAAATPASAPAPVSVPVSVVEPAPVPGPGPASEPAPVPAPKKSAAKKSPAPPPKHDRMEYFPRLRASWHLYKADALGGGHHAFDLEFFPYHRYFRVGLFGEAGIHRRLDRTDFIVGGGVIGGVQWNGQWSPYVDTSLLLGARHTRLFDENLFDPVFRWTLEAGLEFYPNPGLLMFLAVGYAHLVLAPGFVPSAMIRLGVGL